MKKIIGGVSLVEPALTPPPATAAQPTFAKKTKIGTGKSKTKKRDIPEGLWTKCPTCETMIFDKETRVENDPRSEIRKLWAEMPRA